MKRIKDVWYFVAMTLSWLVDLFVEHICGYGESLYRLLLSIFIVVVVLFPAIYYFYGDIGYMASSNGAKAIDQWYEYLYFSLGSFSMVGFQGMVPIDDTTRFISISESLTGVILLGLLAFVLGNRIRNH